MTNSKMKHGKRVLARAVVCGVFLAVLPSCSLIPMLRAPEPAPDLPGDFTGTSSPENSAQLGVAEFFNDPLLTSLVADGLAGNRELKLLEEEVQIASNDVLARQGAYLPFISAGANTGLDRPSFYTPLGAAENQLLTPTGGRFPDPLGNFQLGLNFFWQIDIWRELRNARDAAMQRQAAAVERRNYFVTRLVADIAENYYGLMALDKRFETLDQIIALQKKSLDVAQSRLKAGEGTLLAVKRFEAEVSKNESEKLIVRQDIIMAENRINFLLNRFPQPVERTSAKFFELDAILKVGVPAQLLENRPDIRQAERELQAAGLDVQVARAHFLPKLDITAGVGYEAFNPKFLFYPEALLYNVAGNLVMPLVNFKAIKAEYRTANARQLQTVYNYQRTVLNAFTEVVNRVSMADNYRKSINLKKQQLASLDTSVDVATKLWQQGKAEYVEVLLAQRDFMDAKMVLIDTKKEQLAAIVNAYQALGGGGNPSIAPREESPSDPDAPPPDREAPPPDR